MPRSVSNPPNPYASVHVDYLGEAPSARLEVMEERARTVLSSNESPDVPFRWSLNPYRGCVHACAYCYARPMHSYLDLGAGTDFDRKIVVKINAAEALQRELDAPSWRGETIVFSGATDCYQPHEAHYGVTRACLEVCAAYRNPMGVITKSALVRRDVDVLQQLARDANVMVYLSIPFANEANARSIEPFAATPARRFETLRILSDAGIPTGVAIAPVIPGLNEADIPEILERAREAGARRAFCILLRLPREVLPIFDQRIEEAMPLRAEKIRRAIRDVRGGRTYDSRFGKRMEGAGPRWNAIEQLFHIHCERLGLQTGEHAEPEATTFRRPTRQLALF